MFGANAEGLFPKVDCVVVVLNIDVEVLDTTEEVTVTLGGEENMDEIITGVDTVAVSDLVTVKSDGFSESASLFLVLGSIPTTGLASEAAGDRGFESSATAVGIGSAFAVISETIGTFKNNPYKNINYIKRNLHYQAERQSLRLF